jgi:hypothetical protein
VTPRASGQSDKYFVQYAHSIYDQFIPASDESYAYDVQLKSNPAETPSNHLGVTFEHTGCHSPTEDQFADSLVFTNFLLGMAQDAPQYGNAQPYAR